MPVGGNVPLFAKVTFLTWQYPKRHKLTKSRLVFSAPKFKEKPSYGGCTALLFEFKMTQRQFMESLFYICIHKTCRVFQHLHDLHHYEYCEALVVKAY